MHRIRLHTANMLTVEQVKSLDSASIIAHINQTDAACVQKHK